jgi:hypothetical protein
MLDRQRVCVFFLDNLGNVIINGVYYEYNIYIYLYLHTYAHNFKPLATLYLVMSQKMVSVCRWQWFWGEVGLFFGWDIIPNYP